VIENKQFREIVDDAEILIIVPPFYLIGLPYMAAHILKAQAEEKGFKVSIFYANIAFAKWIGTQDYTKFIYASCPEMLGERIFSNTAFGIDNSFSRSSDYNKRYSHEPDYISKSTTYSKSNLNEISNLFERVKGTTEAYIQFYVNKILDMNFKIIGCSTTFEQTTASISFLK
jgi:peroxiredoxin family protein